MRGTHELGDRGRDKSESGHGKKATLSEDLLPGNDRGTSRVMERKRSSEENSLPGDDRSQDTENDHARGTHQLGTAEAGTSQNAGHGK